MESVRLPPDGDPLAEALDLIEGGCATDAARILEETIVAGRGGLLARTTLVRALLACGRPNEALECARETSQLYPTAAVAALTLGNALSEAGQLPTAIAELQRALRIDPALDEARYRLGCAWLEAGEAEKALQEFGAVALDHMTPELAQKVAEAEAARRAARSNAGYVRHLFDQFSADYDVRMLGQLGYSAPHILRSLASMVMPEVPAHSLSILDLGCGTGLAGVAFADLAIRLDGVDLSPAMIEKARARNIYHHLSVADIETAPFEESEYDLVVAADTLVYLGDLDGVFTNVRSALKPEGSFLCTVEKDSGDGHSLGPKRRWRHSENYLRSVALASGFEMTGMMDCSPRTEAGVPVPGLAAVMRKVS
jgi:predicted TPR repeat methyltransferase